MTWQTIQKSSEALSVPPNLQNYEQARASFSWSELCREIELLPAGNGLNIAHVAVDRHANGPRRNHLALRWLGKDGDVQDFTYLDLKRESNRLANVLQQFGLGKGDRVFVLAGRIPALYIAALSTLKNRSVFCPLFSAFGPEPIFQRMERGDATLLVTTRRLYQQKVADLRERLPKLKHVLLTDVAADLGEGLYSLPRLMAEASADFEIPPTNPEDMAVLHFTSGTTGMPKGAIHLHNAIYVHYMTAKYVLDLHPEDIFWCTADPGWVTATLAGDHRASDGRRGAQFLEALNQHLQEVDKL